MGQSLITDLDLISEFGATSAKRCGSDSGSGELWRVETPDRVFACKICKQPVEQERIERTAEGLARIDSPNVTRLLGEHPVGEITLQDGSTYPFILSEFIDGGDAEQGLDSGVPSEGDTRAFIKGVLNGLVEIHAVNVVHRDLKPANIMLRDGDWAAPVLVDFGFLRLTDKTSITEYPWTGGTRPYKSPEQWEGDRAGHLSDMWSAAVIGLEVGTGRHPYSGEWSNRSDVLARLEASPQIPANAPPGLVGWAVGTNNFKGFKRKNAAASLMLLEEVWK